MARKTTMLLLLLMLASVQLFATSCATRCAAMSMPGAAGSMPGMEHCSGTMFADSGNDSGLRCILAPQGCTHEICKDDLSIAKDHSPLDQTDAVMHTFAGAAMSAAAVVVPASFDRSLRPPTEQKTSSNLVPLISNLRV